MKNYCTYFTIYNGKNDLPPYYIGSTSVKKINEGYKGSVVSRTYKDLWEDEIKLNSSSFKTIILNRFDTRKEALEDELKWHKILNVVKSDLFVNMALACPNGFFGKNNSGNSHHCYGKPLSEETKKKISQTKKGNSPSHMKGKNHTEEAKQKMRIGHENTKYIVITPNNEILVINNMRKFCLDNSLERSCVFRCLTKKYRHHHNYKFFHYTEDLYNKINITNLGKLY